MNSLVQLLNLWGERFLSFAWPMLWQSSVLIAFLFMLDLVIRRRARATVRYALWMLVLIKLVLPTSLSFPTSPGYWVQAPAVLDAALAIETPRESPRPAPEPDSIVDSSSSKAEALPVQERAESPLQPAAAAAFSPVSYPLLRWPAFIGMSWLFGVAALSLLVVLRGRVAWRLVADASDAPDEVQSLVGECARKLGVTLRIAAKVTDALATPVVCDLFRPVILLPKTLANRLTPEQLRAVLLHELAHVRRGDLWVSHLQTALQILHFFNPLLWLANARIRSVREEAVDEMVLVALADDAEVYPETLLKVAKCSLPQPSLAFGLIGILENKSSLSQRIRLMLLRPWPKSARLGFKGITALLLLAAVLLPMSCAKKKMATATSSEPTPPPQVRLEVKFIELPVETANQLVPPDKRGRGSFSSSTSLWMTVLSPEQARLHVLTLQTASDTILHSTPGVTVSNGQQAHIELTNFLHAIYPPPFVVDVPAGNMQFVAPPSASLPTGHALDVTPLASADGRSLELTLLPALIEFLGYDSWTNIVGTNNSVRMTVRSPLPRLRVRQVATRASILNGQTVVLGGLPVQYTTDKVPLLGDLPTIGPHERTVLIFVTAKVVGTADQTARSEATPPMTNGTAPYRSGTLTQVFSDQQLKNLLATMAEREVPLRIDERGRYLLGERELNFDELTRVIADTFPNASSNIYVRVADQAPVSAVARFARACSELGLVATIIHDSSPTTADDDLPIPPASSVFSPARQAIYRKLNTIVLEEVRFDHPLREVVRLLQKETLLRDPEKKGINFMISRHADTPVQRSLPPTTHSTELTNAPELDNLQIKLALNHVRLIDLLNAIVMVSEQPIKFTVEDFAVLFTVKPTEVQPLYTKFFKMDTNAIYQKLGIEGYKSGTFTGVQGGLGPISGVTFGFNRSALSFEVSSALRRLFQASGVELQPPKAIIFNDRAGYLMVHATLEEMEIIEDTLHVLNASPPQVKIEVKFLEVEGGTDLGVALTNAPVDLHAVAVIFGHPPNSLPGIKAASSAVQMTGILTDPQARSFITSMEKRDGSDIVVAPTVTTLSGRQAHIEVTDLKTFRSGINPQALVLPGVASINGEAPIFLTNQIPFGPVLDIFPTISADGFTVQLTAIATVNEWLGYGDTSEDAAVQVYVDGMVQSVKRPRPRIRVRTMATTISVWDGQTLMVGNPKEVILENDAAGVPTETPGNSRKRLLLLITPTIMDPTGNPLHTDADMPFRTNSIPRQKAAAPPR